MNILYVSRDLFYVFIEIFWTGFLKKLAGYKQGNPFVVPGKKLAEGTGVV